MTQQQRVVLVRPTLALCLQFSYLKQVNSFIESTAGLLNSFASESERSLELVSECAPWELLAAGS